MTNALTVQTIDLRPNPAPYGAVRMRKGIWDQLQARKAYEQTLSDREPPAHVSTGLNLEV